MTASLREAAQMALEVMDAVSARLSRYDIPGVQNHISSNMSHSIEALRAALAAPEADPVAWEISYTDWSGDAQKAVHGHNTIGDYRVIDPAATSTPLFAAPRPAPVERQPLTDEQKENIWIAKAQLRMYAKQIFIDGMNAAEAAHHIKAAP